MLQAYVCLYHATAGSAKTNMAAPVAESLIGRPRSTSLLKDSHLRGHHTISVPTGFTASGRKHTYAPLPPAWRHTLIKTGLTTPKPLKPTRRKVCGWPILFVGRLLLYFHANWHFPDDGSFSSCRNLYHTTTRTISTASHVQK